MSSTVSGTFWEVDAGDRDPQSGLGLYIERMLAVMAFDTERKGRSISAVGLASNTEALVSGRLAATRLLEEAAAATRQPSAGKRRPALAAWK